MLRPCSSPGLRDELRGKKRIEAARVREVCGEEPWVCELTADSSGKRRRQQGGRLQTWSRVDFGAQEVSFVGWLWERGAWAGEALSCPFGLVQLLQSAGPPGRAAAAAELRERLPGSAPRSAGWQSSGLLHGHSWRLLICSGRRKAKEATNSLGFILVCTSFRNCTLNKRTGKATHNSKMALHVLL